LHGPQLSQLLPILVIADDPGKFGDDMNLEGMDEEEMLGECTQLLVQVCIGACMRLYASV
jgi:hypothetical protein